MPRKPSAPQALRFEPPAGASATTAFSPGDPDCIALVAASRVALECSARHEPDERAVGVELAARRGQHAVAAHRIADERDARRIDGRRIAGPRGQPLRDPGDVERPAQQDLAGKPAGSVMGGSAWRIAATT